MQPMWAVRPSSQGARGWVLFKTPTRSTGTKHRNHDSYEEATRLIADSQVCEPDWSPLKLLERVAQGQFHALIDTGACKSTANFGRWVP